MKYKVFRLIKRLEFKEIEAKSEVEALKHYTDPKEGFTVVCDGKIIDHYVEKE